VQSFVTATGPADEGSVFTLFGSQTHALKQPDPVARRYVIYADTLDGLYGDRVAVTGSGFSLFRRARRTETTVC
jgi:hypothetical protein